MIKKHLNMVGLSLVLMSASVAAQDITESTVLAYDRKANILVLTDRSVFPLEKLVGDVPSGLKSGDRITIKYESNEDDGITKILSIMVLPK